MDWQLFWTFCILNVFNVIILWKVEATVLAEHAHILDHLLKTNAFSYSMMPVVGSNGEDSYQVFNIYCPTSADSHTVREILNAVKAKYFVSESQSL